MITPVFIVAGVFAVLLGVVVGLAQQAIVAYLTTVRVSRSDALVWFWLVIGFLATLIWVYPTMASHCEPTVTCHFVP